MSASSTATRDALHDFVKAAPVGFRLAERCDPAGTTYKYLVCGKGCTLGVLFEDSVHIYFEWLTEAGRVVDYPAALRYRAWPKHEFARLLSAGVWEATCGG